MEIDALLLFARILKNFDFTETELSILQSYVKNKNININMSLRDNAEAFMDENQLTVDDCREIRKILVDNEEYIYEPIYKLLLHNIKLRSLLISAQAANVLNDKSILDIVETILSKVDEPNFVEGPYGWNQFLLDFLAKRRFFKNNIMQESRIINEYVKKNEDTVVNERNRTVENYDSKFFRRVLLYKLFSCGYVTFDYNQKLDPSSSDSGIASIVEPLIESRSYGHLKLMINLSTLSSQNMEELKLVVKRAYKALYNGEVSKEEAESDSIFIDKLNIFFKSAHVEPLDYNELSKKVVGINL